MSTSEAYAWWMSEVIHEVMFEWFYLDYKRIMLYEDYHYQAQRSAQQIAVEKTSF